MRIYHATHPDSEQQARAALADVQAAGDGARLFIHPPTGLLAVLDPDESADELPINPLEWELRCVEPN